MGGRRHHADAVDVGEPAQGGLFVADTVLRAGDRRAARTRRRECVERLGRVLALGGDDHDVPGRGSASAGWPTAGTRKVTVPVGDATVSPFDRIASQVLATSDQDHVVTRLEKPAADHAADGAGSDDYVSQA